MYYTLVLLATSIFFWNFSRPCKVSISFLYFSLVVTLTPPHRPRRPLLGPQTLQDFQFTSFTIFRRFVLVVQSEKATRHSPPDPLTSD